MKAFFGKTFVVVAMMLAIGVIVAAALLPLPQGADETSSTSTGGVQPAARPGDVLPLASFAPAWDVKLRRSLTEVPSTGPANGDGAPTIRLVGTIVDAARPRGIFVTNFGQMELRAVGEKAGGAEVLRIDERSATLLLAGRQVTLKVEKIESTLPIGEPTQPSADAAGSGQR